MITPEQIAPIGKLVKPHGINGEIAALLQVDVDIDAARCLIVEIDGIFVPFFVESWRRKSAESVLIRFSDIDDERQAKELCGKSLFCLREDIGEDVDSEELGEDGFYADDLVGFTIVDDASGDTIGTINDYDDSTENALFIVGTPDGGNIYIPVADEFITDVDTDAHTLTMDLPEGLISVNI